MHDIARWLRLRWRSAVHRSSAYLIAAAATSTVFGFLFWIVAARLYPAADVGLAGAAISAIGLLTSLTPLGLDYALVRFLPNAEDPRSIIDSSMTVGIIASLVLAMAFLSGLSIWLPGLAALPRSPLFAPAVVVATVCWTISTLLVSVFMAKGRADLVWHQSLISVASRLLYLIALAGNFHAMALFGAWTLGLVTATVWGLASFLPLVESGHYRFRVAVKRELVNDMAHFASANYVTSLLWNAPSFLLPLLVINTAGHEANAYFYVAWNVNGLLAAVPIAVSTAVFAHGSSDEGRLIEHTIQSGKFTFALLLPAAAAVFLFGKTALLIIGKAYSARATLLLDVLALSTLPMAVNFLFFSVGRVRRRMAPVVANSLWVLVATVGTGAVLLPRVGVIGAGLGWLVAQSSAALVVVAAYMITGAGDRAGGGGSTVTHR